MHPILLKIGPLTIYSYGVMVAIGFGLAAYFIYGRAPKFHIERSKIIDLCMVVLIAGIIGARLFYVLLNPAYYLANPFEIIMLSSGGLVWYGGFLSALGAFVLYVRRAGLNFWEVADLFVPYLALAQGLGRIGCFLNGCCYGKPSSAGFIFAMRSLHDPIPRYPVQVYDAIALFLIFLILRIWQDRKHFSGEVFLGYCTFYSYERFLIEFLRDDNPKILPGLTISQVISVAVLAAAIALFIYKAIKWKRRSSNLR